MVIRHAQIEGEKSEYLNQIWLSDTNIDDIQSIRNDDNERNTLILTVTGNQYRFSFLNINESQEVKIYLMETFHLFDNLQFHEQI